MAKELFNPPVQTDVSGARVRDRLNCEGADILGFLFVSPDDPPVPNDDPIRLFWLQNPPGVLWMWSEQFGVWFPIAGEQDPFGIFFGGDASSTFPNDINGGDSASVFQDDVFGGDSASVNGADVLGSFFPGGGGGPP